MNKPAVESRLSEGALWPVASPPLQGIHRRPGGPLIVKRLRLCYPKGWSNDPEALARVGAGYFEVADPLRAAEPASPFQVLRPGLPLAGRWFLLLVC